MGRAIITKSELRRRLDALREAGYGVAEIKADGTIVTTVVKTGYDHESHGSIDDLVNQRLAQQSWAKSR